MHETFTFHSYQFNLNTPITILLSMISWLQNINFSKRDERLLCNRIVWSIGIVSSLALLILSYQVILFRQAKPLHELYVVSG